MDFDDGSAGAIDGSKILYPRSVKAHLKEKNILMSQKSVLIVVNYMRKTA
jgi:hypothetical protein